MDLNHLEVEKEEAIEMILLNLPKESLEILKKAFEDEYKKSKERIQTETFFLENWCNFKGERNIEVLHDSFRKHTNAVMWKIFSLEMQREIKKHLEFEND